MAANTDEEKKKSHYKNLMKEIEEYLNNLSNTNPKLGMLMRKLWKKVQEVPEEFTDQRVSYVLEEMRKEAIRNVVSGFAEEWCVSESAVIFAAERIDVESDTIPGLNNIKESADYAKYEKTHGKIPKFKYNQAIKKALFATLHTEVIPFRDDDYSRLDDRIAMEYTFLPEEAMAYVAEKPDRV